METTIRTNIVFTSVLDNITNIFERNLKFDSLSKKEQRREIAWDCLQLILSGSISGSVTSGYWSSNLSKIVNVASTSNEVQRVLNNNLPNDCKVCARGGMMLSQIRLKCPSETSAYLSCGSSDNIVGFDMKVFKRMENEYEFSHYKHPYGSDTTEKLANMCCNIIVNGNFKVSDKTNYLLQ